DTGFAADAATGRGNEAALPAGRLDDRRIAGVDVDDVLLRIGVVGRTVSNRGDVVVAADDSLGEEKSGGEIEIITRGPHRDRDAAAGEADLEWLLDCQHVLARLRSIALPGNHSGACH